MLPTTPAGLDGGRGSGVAMSSSKTSHLKNNNSLVFPHCIYIQYVRSTVTFGFLTVVNLCNYTPVERSSDC